LSHISIEHCHRNFVPDVAKLAGRNEQLPTETAYGPDRAIVDW
jgi:hypothetical protein